MASKPLSITRFGSVLLGLFILVVICAALSLFLGGIPIDWTRALQDPASADHAIIYFARLPRILLGILVGFSLSTGGVAFQSLLRNPLADPYILGVSGGAALGSVIAVIFTLPFAWVSTTAFGFSLGALLLIYWIARTGGRLPVHTLLLTGVIFNAFTFALIMFLNSLASFEQAHRIWYLMVGSLEAESYGKLVTVAAFVAAGYALLQASALPMNLIATGEEGAQYLGLDVHKFRRRIFFAASLMIGATVSLSGLIGFVGLFVPHMMRLWLGSDHRLLLPASGLFGAAFLVLADTLARTAFGAQTYQTQLPVGVITALIGGPFFVYLLKRGTKKALW